MDQTNFLRSSRTIEATPFFYGWVVLGVSTLSSILMGPSQTFTVSLFVLPMVESLGLTQSSMSLIYGVATLAASLMLPVTGRMVDRFGPRVMMVAVSAGLGVVLLGMGRVNGLVPLFIGLLLLRFFGFGSIQLVGNNAISQWFVKRRGTVMGLYNQSLSLSLVLFPWLAALLIDSSGWRTAWMLMGILVLVLLVPASWFLLRDRPELYGLEPDGSTAASGCDQFGGPVAEENWTLAEARGTAAFWVFIFAFASMTLIFSTLAFHQVSIFAEQGLSRSVAVRSFQMIALVSIFSNLVVGRLIDSASARMLMAATLLLQVLMLFWIQRMQIPLHGLIFGVIMGTASGSYRILDSAIWPKYFGRRHLGSIKGVTLIGTLGGAALGPYPLGLSADYLGSFGPALNALMILPLALAVVVYFGIRRPEKKPALAKRTDQHEKAVIGGKSPGWRS